MRCQGLVPSGLLPLVTPASKWNRIMTLDELSDALSRFAVHGGDIIFTIDRPTPTVFVYAFRVTAKEFDANPIQDTADVDVEMTTDVANLAATLLAAINAVREQVDKTLLYDEPFLKDAAPCSI
jgi:hypothetical protein